jgi:hypothetical protein
MKAEGFTSCKLEPEIWMRRSTDGTKYEYVAVYVDDFALAMDDPKDFLDTLTNKYRCYGSALLRIILASFYCRY